MRLGGQCQCRMRGLRHSAQFRGELTESRRRQVFWLTDRSTGRAFSSTLREWPLRRSSPFTAAGPRWICTTFPLCLPRRRPAPSSIELSSSPSRQRSDRRRRRECERNRAGRQEVVQRRSQGAVALLLSAGGRPLPAPAGLQAQEKRGRAISPRRGPSCHFTAATRRESPLAGRGPSPEVAVSFEGLPRRPAALSLTRDNSLARWRIPELPNLVPESFQNRSRSGPPI